MRLPDGRDQRTVMQAMLDRGVATRRGITSSHPEPAYRDQPGVMRIPAPLVESERASDRCIVIPLFPQTIEQQQQRVAEALATACR